jgi:hypothetical protein
LIRDFYGEAWTIGGDYEIHAAWRPKIDRMKVLAIERWRDVKAAICEYLSDPGQCLAIGYTQGNVVCDAGASLTRPVGRSAKKVDGDRPVRRPIEEAEHRAFPPKLLKT